MIADEMPEVPTTEDTWQEVSDRMVEEIDDMLMIAVYSLDTLKSLAFSFSVAPLHKLGAPRDSTDGVLDNASADDVQNISVVIDASHVQAIVNLIRCKGPAYARLTIATMNFLCLRCNAGCMSGMSNFNMESTSLKKVDQVFFKLTHKHFTRSDSVDELHALCISALLVDDVVLIGLIQAGETSCLEVLREVAKIKRNKGCKTLPIILQRSEQRRTLNVGIPSKDGATFYDNAALDISDAGKPPSSPEVRLRPRAENGSDVRRESSRRATSFCEDWRTATMKSIQAMTMAGQLKPEDDEIPLVGSCEDFDQDYFENPATTADGVTVHPVPPQRKRRESRVTDV